MLKFDELPSDSCASFKKGSSLEGWVFFETGATMNEWNSKDK